MTQLAELREALDYVQEDFAHRELLNTIDNLEAKLEGKMVLTCTDVITLCTALGMDELVFRLAYDVE